jgi:hypothetical protein
MDYSRGLDQVWVTSEPSDGVSEWAGEMNAHFWPNSRWPSSFASAIKCIFGIEKKKKKRGGVECCGGGCFFLSFFLAVCVYVCVGISI